MGQFHRESVAELNALFEAHVKCWPRSWGTGSFDHMNHFDGLPRIRPSGLLPVKPTIWAEERTSSFYKTLSVGDGVLIEAVQQGGRMASPEQYLVVHLC